MPVSSSGEFPRSLAEEAPTREQIEAEEMAAARGKELVEVLDLAELFQKAKQAKNPNILLPHEPIQSQFKAKKD